MSARKSIAAARHPEGHSRVTSLVPDASCSSSFAACWAAAPSSGSTAAGSGRPKSSSAERLPVPALSRPGDAFFPDIRLLSFHLHLRDKRQHGLCAAVHDLARESPSRAEQPRRSASPRAPLSSPSRLDAVWYVLLPGAADAPGASRSMAPFNIRRMGPAIVVPFRRAHGAFLSVAS